MATKKTLLEQLTEAKRKITLNPLPYARDELAPVMSKGTVDYHYGDLASAYAERFNRGEGDPRFNEAGVFLHNLFFEQFRAPTTRSPTTTTLGPKLRELIVRKYGSFDKFRDEFFKVAMAIQGSGWAYMTPSGEFKTIVNHEVRDDVLILIDWWEHAWALDYQADKKAYFTNLWKIFNWDVIERRLESL